MSKEKPKKSPLAIARDEYLKSIRGKMLCKGTASGQYIRNRIELAFIDGWKMHQRHLLAKGE